MYDGGFRQHKKSRAERLFDDEGTAARFFYCAPAPKRERVVGCTVCGASGLGVPPCACRHPDDDAKPAPTRSHPTVKPLSLMRYLCRLVTPPGGVVLDPFAGSGTTLQAAVEEGFGAIGIEREAEYVADIRTRLGMSEAA